MALVDIKINGRNYKLSCPEEEVQNIRKVGEELNHMAADIISAVGPVNEGLLLVMLAVLAKDEANTCKKAKEKTNKDMQTVMEKISIIAKKIEKA